MLSFPIISTSVQLFWVTMYRCVHLIHNTGVMPLLLCLCHRGLVFRVSHVLMAYLYLCVSSDVSVIHYSQDVNLLINCKICCCVVICLHVYLTFN